jgi:uncharacterized membrane-anchored protein YhcB (DUF1043 family)
MLASFKTFFKYCNMFMLFIGLVAGMIIGAMFAPVIMKWVTKAKSAGKEFSTDVKDQYKKTN